MTQAVLEALREAPPAWEAAKGLQEALLELEEELLEAGVPEFVEACGQRCEALWEVAEEANSTARGRRLSALLAQHPHGNGLAALRTAVKLLQPRDDIAGLEAQAGLDIPSAGSFSTMSSGVAGEAYEASLGVYVQLITWSESGQCKCSPAGAGTRCYSLLWSSQLD